jgi:thiol:disulfide interchange protein DsbD
MHVARALLLGLVAAAVWGAPARASENVAVALLAEQASVQPGRPFHVGLRMKIRRGWHTYWKNPGDSGLPLRIAWDLPGGFSAGPIEWPAPERFQENTLVTYGYGGEAFFPIEIVPPDSVAGDSVTIAGTFDWLECAEVCVPASATLRLSLPVRPETPKPGRAAREFTEARSRIPAAPAAWKFTAEAGPRAISLEFDAPPGTAPRSAYFFSDQPLVVDYAAPQGFERLNGGYRATVVPNPNADGPPERLTGVLAVEGRPGSRRTTVQVDVPVSAGDPAPAPVPGEEPLRPAPPYVAVIAAAAIGLAALLLRSAIGRKKSGPRPEPNR